MIDINFTFHDMNYHYFSFESSMIDGNVYYGGFNINVIEHPFFNKIIGIEIEFDKNEIRKAKLYLKLDEEIKEIYMNIDFFYNIFDKENMKVDIDKLDDYFFEINKKLYLIYPNKMTEFLI